jgi:hypothetical protein
MNAEPFGVFNNTIFQQTNAEMAEGAERATAEAVERSERADEDERNCVVAMQIKAEVH